MIGLLLIGIAMSITTVVFWYIELRPFLIRVRHMQETQKSILVVVDFVTIVLLNTALFVRYGIHFVFDILLTLFLVSQLGLSGGLLGSVIGLSLSNGISLILLVGFTKRNNI